MTSLINKAKKPKFDLHLRIYDLNNVPLVSGVSQVKWHLPHSIHGEHRGRTDKRPIANHKVEYGFGRVVPLRIHIDRNNNLEECPIEFEVAQEFGPGEDRVVLGKVTLNLSEYVVESEEILRQRPYATSGGASSAAAAVAGAASAASAAVGDQLHHQAGKLGVGHSRTRSSTVGANAASFVSSSSFSQPASSSPSNKKDGGSSGGDSGSGSSGSTHQNDGGTVLHPDVQEGVIRRHLMQESKINSTLKIGILMIQIDGDRSFVAPALRTAPAFGGIAGLGVTGEQLDQDDTKRHVPTVLKHRDPAELDMYRTTLTASIASPPSQGELAADACIEDIFSGGTGFTDPDVGPLLFSDGSGRNSAMSHRGVGFADDSNDVAARSNATNHRRQRSARSSRFSATSSLAPPSPWGSGNGSGNGSPSSADDDGAGGGAGSATLRPRDVRGFFGTRPGDGGGARPSNHRRQRSGASDKSARTLIVSAGGGNNGNGGTLSRSRSRGEHDDNNSNNNSNSNSSNNNGTTRRGGGGGGGGVSREPSRARSGSLVSLATTNGGDSSDRSDREHRGRDGFRRAREVDEFEVRDDLVAWRLPGKVS
ncbi:hypothetical protein RB595_010281 [Gaeumannomyces hyphopodioides]